MRKVYREDYPNLSQDYTHIAVDKSGTVYAHTIEPKLDYTLEVWASNDQYMLVSTIDKEFLFLLDWETSVYEIKETV